MTKKADSIDTWAIIVLGALICAAALDYLPLAKMDWRLAILFVLNVTVVPRMSLQIPRSSVHVTMGDAMFFLTFLLYGGEFAILLAVSEALVTTYRMKRQGVISKLSTVFKNASLMAFSTAGTYCAFLLYPYLIDSKPDYNNPAQFIVLLGSLALVQFGFNTTLVALLVSLEHKISFWRTLGEKCFSVSVACIFGAVVAGVLYQLIETSNVSLIVVISAIIGVLYFTYNNYLSEITRSQQQAEQAEIEKAETEQKRATEAEKHIAELSSHISEQDRISEALRQSKERFQHAALHDALTTLPNRMFFFDRIKHLLERSRLNGDKGFCILFMDLDKFKNVNDSLGHAFGDKLLVKVARRLEKTVRGGDIVARLGGDEFAIMLTDINQAEAALNFANRIHHSLAQPFKIDGHQVFTAPSIGIAMSSTEYETPEEILRDADIAMYDAKEKKIGCAVFDRELRVRAINNIKLESDLREAVEKEQFRVFYQPIISLETGQLAGFEALMRWEHPERGMIPPIEFIPTAESNGQIVPMTNWILWQACSQLSRWRWRSPANRSLIISVNISSRHFKEPDLVEQVKHTLQETGLDARCLKLELTESAVMENAEAAIQALHGLRAIGVQLSIDDFGTGYSSLSYLHKFPIDTLKVDRSFISRMGDSGENSEIVKTIITLAHNMNLNVIAEGVETAAHVEILRGLGCRFAQGFLFAKPLPQEEIDEIMKSPRNWLPEGVMPLLSTAPARHSGKLVSLPMSSRIK